MSKISEETTKGLVSNKLKNTLGYPTSQNVTVSGITWFKEDSYKGTNYNWLDSVFAKATKKQTLQSKGMAVRFGKGRTACLSCPYKHQRFSDTIKVNSRIQA